MRWATNYATLLPAIKVKNVADILVSESPSLALIKNSGNQGEVSALSILVDLLNNFLDFFSIGKGMSAMQVIETAKMILEDYSILKPDDFVLFFNRAKKSHYGKVYDRMDGALIFEWLELFMNERCQEIESIRINEKKRLDKAEKENIKAVPMPDYVKQFINKKVVEKPKEVTLLNQTEQQKQINGWMYEFDNLWCEQGSRSGIKVVEVEGKKMDIGEYLIYKSHGKQIQEQKDSSRRNSI